MGFDGGIDFSLRSVHVTHQHPTFRALVIVRMLCCAAPRRIFQVQAMHGGRCRDPRLDVFPPSVLVGLGATDGAFG